jgi:hypothetical protein
VLNVTRRHCQPEVFAAFNAAYHIALDRIAVLATPSLPDIATELKLQS